MFRRSYGEYVMKRKKHPWTGLCQDYDYHAIAGKMPGNRPNTTKGDAVDLRQKMEVRFRFVGCLSETKTKQRGKKEVLGGWE